jgi:hypothetical protein
MASEQLPQYKPTEYQTPEPKVDHSAQQASEKKKEAIVPNLLQPELPHKKLPPPLPHFNPDPNAPKLRDPKPFTVDTRPNDKDTDPNAPKLPGKLRDPKPFTVEKLRDKDTDPNAPKLPHKLRDSKPFTVDTRPKTTTPPNATVADTVSNQTPEKIVGKDTPIVPQQGPNPTVNQPQALNTTAKVPDIKPAQEPSIQQATPIPAQRSPLTVPNLPLETVQADRNQASPILWSNNPEPQFLQNQVPLSAPASRVAQPAPPLIRNPKVAGFTDTISNRYFDNTVSKDDPRAWDMVPKTGLSATPVPFETTNRFFKNGEAYRTQPSEPAYGEFTPVIWNRNSEPQFSQNQVPISAPVGRVEQPAPPKVEQPKEKVAKDTPKVEQPKEKVAKDAPKVEQPKEQVAKDAPKVEQSADPAKAAQKEPEKPQAPKTPKATPMKTTEQLIQSKPLQTLEQSRRNQKQVPSAVMLNNKTQPTFENLNNPASLSIQAKQIGQGTDGKAIADTALKNPQQFLSDSQQNLKGIKAVKPTEPADESWFEEPEHQKGLAIAAAGVGTALLGLALIISAPVSLPALIIGGAIVGAGLAAARQGAQVVDGDRKSDEFSFEEVAFGAVAGGVITPIAAPVLAVMPELGTAIAAGQVANGAKEAFVDGNYATGLLDVGTAVAPFVGSKGVRDASFGKGTLFNESLPMATRMNRLDQFGYVKPITDGLFPAPVPPTSAVEPQVAQGLNDVRPHVTETNFYDRAANKTGQGTMPTTVKGQAVPAQRTVELEPKPGMPADASITKAEVPRSDGSGKSWKLKNVDQLPSDPQTKMRLTQQNGESVDWVSGQNPPEDFRLKINPSREMRESGFSGGHTRDAWNETQSTYGDVINVKQQDQMSFRLPGQENLTDVSMMRYEVRATGDTSPDAWKNVTSPKTIFEGNGNASIDAFQEHMTPYVAEQMDLASITAREVPVEIPVQSQGGLPVKLKVTVMRNEDLTGATKGQITSWWIDEGNLSNPMFAKPSDYPIIAQPLWTQHQSNLEEEKK